MADEDWQQQFETLASRSAHLMKTGYKSDCCFLVGVGKKQSLIKAHKLFLSMASPVFERMFYSDFEESSKDVVVNISDVETHIFQKILEYIYIEKLTITSVHEACELYYAARKYLLTHMSKNILEYIKKNVTTSNACRVLEFARLFEDQTLIAICLEIIKCQTSLVLKDTSFLDVSMETLLLIFSQERLNIITELDLFDALTRYAENKKINAISVTPSQDHVAPAHAIGTGDEQFSRENSIQSCKKMHLTSSDMSQLELISESDESIASFCSSLIDPEDLKKQLREALKKIRFLNLTPKQFAKSPALSDMLLAEEKVAIFVNLSDPSSSIPMPKGFSTSRQNRRRESNLNFLDDTSRIPRPILHNGLRVSNRAPLRSGFLS